jgi:ferritin
MKYMTLKPEAMKILKPLYSIEASQIMFYKQLSAVANKLGFLRAEKYFLAESQEEATHFDKWQNYIVGRGNDFQVPGIEAPEDSSKNLYELIESALKMEIEVSDMYNEAAMKLMGVDQLAYQECIDFLKIQNEAISTYTDYCAVLEGLDKDGQLVAEHSLFED